MNLLVQHADTTTTNMMNQLQNVYIIKTMPDRLPKDADKIAISDAWRSFVKTQIMTSDGWPHEYEVRAETTGVIVVAMMDASEDKLRTLMLVTIMLMNGFEIEVGSHGVFKIADKHGCTIPADVEYVS